MQRIFSGKVIKDCTSPTGFYLRNLQMDKIYDSRVMFSEFEGREVIVKISDLEEQPHGFPRKLVPTSV